MLVLLDVGEDIDLIDGALLQFFILLETTHFNHLDRVLLAIVLIDGPVDFPVCALPDYLVESVILYYAHHSIIIINIHLPSL